MGTINIKQNEVPIREFRLGAVTGYVGTIGDLHDRAAAGCDVGNRERCFTQASACSSGCCQGQLGSIKDAIVVNHAPVGCAADAVASNVKGRFPI